MGKYVDTTAVMQVIGNIYINTDLLDNKDKYFFLEDDFVGEFHKTLFGTIYNLYNLGVKQINKEAIYNYLKERPKKLALYEVNKGDEYLDKLVETTQINAFDYYYNRLKKFTLLRAYNDIGISVNEFYDDDNILDIKKKQMQEDLLDNTSLENIAKVFDDKITNIRMKYVDDFGNDSVAAGEGIFDLVARLKKTPEVGIPLFGPLINTVTRGARLKKFYLRSASTGLGKSRTLAADAAFIACRQMWDFSTGTWIDIGESQAVTFITTEQEVEEVQTMLLSFVSGVNEDHILYGYYINDEEERVLKAAQIISEAPFFIEELHDFSLQDIENTIKRNIREHECYYIFMDYIHSSMKILTEITKRSGIELREDNILYMMSVRMKDICNEYGVFIESATQLNGKLFAIIYLIQELTWGLYTLKK